MTIHPSATATMHRLALEKKERGEVVYNLAAGDPILTNHPAIIQAAVKASAKGDVPYPPVAGIPELRTLASAWMNENYGANYSKENCLVTCGGKFALFAALQAVLNRGDEVLMIAPYWVSYPEMVKLFGGVPKIIAASEESGWKISAADLRRHISEKSRVLIFNNACNPTGVLYTQEEIREILSVAKEANLFILSDEVYSHLVYENGSFVSLSAFPEISENLILVQSCSKNFGMTGWRVGCAFGPEKWMQRLTALQGQSTTGTALISQWAAVGAFENAPLVTSYVYAAMEKRRACFMESYRALFEKEALAPASALYYFTKLRGSENSAAFCERALCEANVALVPGSAFGMEGYVRFAYSVTEEEIASGMHALHRWIYGN